MEIPNVNNLNGIPNFGMGFPEEEQDVVPTAPEEVETPPTEPVDITNQEKK